MKNKYNFFISVILKYYYSICNNSSKKMSYLTLKCMLGNRKDWNKKGKHYASNLKNTFV